VIRCLDANCLARCWTGAAVEVTRSDHTASELRRYASKSGEGGIEGLKSRRSPGRARALNSARMAELEALMVAGPNPA